MRRLFLSLILLSIIPAPKIVAYAQKSGSAQKENFLSQQGIRSIAILPTVGETVHQDIRDAASSMLASALLSQTPSLTITSAEDSTGLLEKTGSLEQMVKFTELLNKTGTVDRPNFQQWAGALKADAIMLVEVKSYEEQGGSWMRGRGGYNQLVIQYTLFTKGRERVWQNIEKHQHQSFWVTRTARYTTLIEKLSKLAVRSLLQGKQNTGLKK